MAPGLTGGGREQWSRPRQRGNSDSREILFLRVPPPGLVRPVSGGNGPVRLPTVFAANGCRGRVGRQETTCFWIGMGRRVRTPGRELLERIRGGLIADILDIGCAGALDPSLRRGDLVLSSEDIAFDSAVPVALRRRPELGSLLQELAAGRGVSFRRAPILTHERFISSREERTELFESTGCAAVQMEQVWFLQLLGSLVADRCLDKLYVTHLVLITDAVPRSGGRPAAVRSTWDALRGYALPGSQGGIGSLRREVLSRWPTH